MTAAASATLIPPGPANCPDDSLVSDLVARARNGDKQAWDALVERYAPLIWSICRRHRLGRADADDIGQSVWLRLVDQLDRVREPAALPGWIATTTRRESLRSTRTVTRGRPHQWVATLNSPATHTRCNGRCHHGSLSNRRAAARRDGGGHHGGLRNRRADDADSAHAGWSEWHCQSPTVVVA